MKRILDCQSSDFRNISRQELLDAIAGSEGRTIACETIGAIMPMLGDITNAEFAAAMGADILLLNNEVPPEVNLLAARIARKHGTRVILNPAPARVLEPELAELVWLFTPNEHERSMVEDRRNLLVTLGGDGCFLKEMDKTLPAAKVSAVVDTTGAGDTFNGVLAAELAEGADLERAAHRAMLAAGISVTRPYAATAIPYREELWEEFL